MKRIPLLAAALLASAAAYAQLDPAAIKSPSINKTSSNEAVTRTDAIGRSTLECVYRTSAPSRHNDGIRPVEDMMILQIDGATTKFYSYYDFALDSLRKADPQALMHRINDIKQGTKSCIYRGYPAADRTTTTDAIASMYYRVEEPTPEQQWSVGEQTREILGYTCRRADCEFRGRRYTAWFAEQIPVGAGPWKLHGLPGLIMAAADSEGEYTFEIVGLSEKQAPIEYTDRKYIVTTREKYLRQKHLYVNDPLGYAVGQGEISIQLNDGSTYEPEGSASRQIVMQETDYKH